MDFKDLIISNRNNVKNIIRLITKQNNEDLEQEVYIKAWKNADKYKEQGSFKSWIMTIAKNVSKDYLKSAVRKQEQNSTSDDEVINKISDNKTTPELKLIQNEKQVQTVKAINSLKSKFKEVIILCEIYGYTYEECAQKIKCPVGTVKSRLYNAKKELAEKLQEYMKG